jgi:type IV secretory pathway VirB2 component (pilin)
MTAPRYNPNSIAARVGRAVLGAILLAIVAGLAWWLGALTWPHWWFWPVEVVLALAALSIVIPTIMTVVRPVPERQKDTAY